MNARKWMFSLMVMAILVLAVNRPMAASVARPARRLPNSRTSNLPGIP